MATRSHANTQKQLVYDLIEDGALKSREVINAFHAVDRGWFLPSHGSPGCDRAAASGPIPSAHYDYPQLIGHHATISAPHMHAMMAELLYQKGLQGKTVLDVGSGSGYLSLVLGLLTGSGGHVVGMEHVPELVESSAAVLRRFLPELDGVVEFIRGDGRDAKIAAAVQAANVPTEYDMIHVGAAYEELPQHLVDMLKPNGRLVVPIGADGAHQELTVVDKQSDGNVHITNVCGVAFVPLTSLTRQEHSLG